VLANHHRGSLRRERYTDRLAVSPAEPATVDGWTGHLFRYSAGDFAVMLRPRDGVSSNGVA
jgi:hypothetical protein